MAKKGLGKGLAESSAAPDISGLPGCMSFSPVSPVSV